MNSPTVTEIQEKTDKLKNTILGLCQQFENETGTNIEIGLSRSWLNEGPLKVSTCKVTIPQKSSETQDVEPQEPDTKTVREI